MNKFLKLTIGDIAYLGDGAHTKVQRYDKGILYLSAKNIKKGFIDYSEVDYISEKDFEKLFSETTNSIRDLKTNDILFSIIGSVGNVYLYKKNDRFGISSSIAIIRVHNSYVEVKYLYWYLRSKFFSKLAQRVLSNSVQNYLNLPLIRTLPIYFPDKLSIQKKIVNILDNIDNKIKLNNKINNELKVIAKTIYDYWFLQFEFPNEEGKPYKSSGGKMVWNEELKREIPEGWINGHLKEYIKNQKAGDWGKENAIDNYQKEVTCIRGADFSSITSFEKMDMPRRFILEKNSFKLLSVYDLLIEISGGSPIQSTGRICYINDAVLKRFSTKLITSNFCKAISLTDNNYFYWFYMLWKTLYINNVFFNYESKTTGIKNLLFDIMCEKYPICKPPIQIIRLYNQQVTPYFNKIQQNIIENQELTSLRDFLLPLLMNGQVGFKGDKAEG